MLFRRLNLLPSSGMKTELVSETLERLIALEVVINLRLFWEGGISTKFNNNLDSSFGDETRIKRVISVSASCTFRKVYL